MLVVGDTGKAILFRINDKNDYWTAIKKFIAHDIMIYDSTYVCSVKSSTEYDLFMTATINGNVKLWTLDGDHLCDINQQKWPKDILSISKNFFDSSSLSPSSPKKRFDNFAISEDDDDDYSSASEISSSRLGPPQSPTKRVNFADL